MPRCRVVGPAVVRLFLVDVHRRELVRVREALAKKQATEADEAIAVRNVKQAEADGDWIDIKKELNEGERRAMFAMMYLAGIDGRLRTNPLQQGISKSTAYLVDWSMVGFDGKKIPIEGQPVESVRSAIDSLDPESAAEIREAIGWHEEAMAQEKNVTAETGVNEPSAISASAAQ